MSDTKKFILLSPDNIEGTGSIKADVMKTKGCEVEMVFTVKAALDKMAKDKADCLIFHVRKLDLPQLNQLDPFRQMNSSLSVIIMTGPPAKEVYGATGKLRRSVILEMPYKVPDLQTLCEKIVNGQEIYQRRHERFATNQQAHVEKLPTGEKFLGSIKNMSRGGALLEVKGAVLQEGDLLKMVVQLDALSKAHEVHGEVVRASSEGAAAGYLLIGIRFISPEDLYIALLQKV